MAQRLTIGAATPRRARPTRSTWCLAAIVPASAVPRGTCCATSFRRTPTRVP